MAFSEILSTVGEAPPSTVAAVLGSVLVAAFLAYELRSWYRLSHVPGPFFHSISIYPLNKLSLSGGMTFRLKSLQEKYGPLVRLGPNLVMFGDPAAYRQISGARSLFFKGPFYSTARVVPDTDSLFSMIDEEARKVLRTKLTPGYSGKEFGGFEPVVDRQIAELVKLIERSYISTPTEYRPIEFAHKMQYFAIDVISGIGYSAPVGFIANDKDMYRYVEINDGFFPIFALLGNMPWLGLMMQRWPFNAALPKDSDAQGFGRLINFATTVVNKRLEGGGAGSDMMEVHIRNGLTKKELTAEVLMEMIAGSDSTAGAIRMLILFLLNTPTALAKLRREIDDGIAEGTISSPIRDAEARQMPYLQAAIKEGIRFYPPQTALNSKEVPAGGAEVNGFRLPGGTQVAVNILAITRSQGLFGPDADVFRPERWIEAETVDPERYKEMCASVELVFGFGKYQCLGKVIAAVELNKVPVELLRRYDFAVVNPVSPIKLYDAGFWVANDLWLRVTRRE